MNSKQPAPSPNASIERMVKDIFSSSYIAADGKRYVDEKKYRKAQQKVLPPLKMEFKLKNVKTFKGVENDQLDADLYCDGKYMATFFDDGWGGGYRIDWADAAAEKLVTEYCAAQPDYISKDLVTAGKPFTCEYSVEFLVDDLFNAYQEEKEKKRLAKLSLKRVMFRFKGDQEGEWRYLPLEYKGQTFTREFVKEYAMKKHGDKIEGFYDEQN